MRRYTCLLDRSGSGQSTCMLVSRGIWCAAEVVGNSPTTSGTAPGGVEDAIGVIVRPTIHPIRAIEYVGSV